MNRGYRETGCVDQRIEEVSTDRIITSQYQRPINMRRAAKIAQEFDAAKLGLLVVSERPNGYYAILDGQHRLAALRERGMSSALVIVLTDLSVEQEANYFRTQYNNVSKLNAYDLYNAGLVAGDPKYLYIERILAQRGYHANRNSGPRAITAVSTLTQIATQFGFLALDTVLAYTQATWPTDSTAVRREMLSGFTEFALRFGNKVSPELFRTRMRDHSPSDLFDEYKRRARGSANARNAFLPSMRYVFCGVIVDAFNKGLGSNSKCRLALEWHGPRIEYDEGGYWQ